MRVIPPIAVASISSSTIGEPDTGETLWVSGTTYPTIGTRRIVAGTVHKVYEKLTTNVSTNLTVSPNLNPIDWLEIGPTNRWAMFDLFRNTASIIPNGGFSTTLALGKRIDSIAIMGAQLTDITITVTSASSGGTIYGPTTTTMVERNPLDYYDYFFLDFSYRASVLIFNIPPVIDAVITISSSAGGKLAAVVLGVSEYLGYTQRGHANDALNFSIIDRDDFGNSILTARRSVPKTSQKLIVTKANLGNVLRIREQLNAVPAVWSGLDDSTEGYFESLLILGIYKELTLSIDYPEYVNCTLELEEL